MLFSSLALSAFLLYLSNASKYEETVPTAPFIYLSSLGGLPYNVTYDERSFIINGERTLLLGGSVHYPRLSELQWDDILMKAREDGLNHVEVYVFWNFHEPTYDFSGNHVYTWDGRANLPLFLQKCQENDLFVNLRIGPYVCAEWDWGGLPVWLLHVDGISYRDDNGPWEDYVSTWVNDLAVVVEPYLAKNGGPIILAQIENEYQGSEAYVDWCGEYAASLNFEIPWVMCNGMSANNTINTCNGNNCWGYAQVHSTKYPGQPLAWTENEGWFQYWGDAYDPNAWGWSNRSPADMAYSVALWFGAGGAHHNYYMWYGGNHIAHTAGSSISNYYADGVNYHADGLPNEPKRSHLYRLHKILADHQKALLESPIQIGKEQYLNQVNFGEWSLYLQVGDCDDSPQWSYNATSGLLSLTEPVEGQTVCVYSTGNSNPVRTTVCNPEDVYQQWSFSNSQFKSRFSSQCLDVYQQNGPNVDEWSCKDPNSDNAQNQQWIWTNGKIQSKSNSDWCLTTIASNSLTFAYVYDSEDDELTFLVNTDAFSNYTLEWNGLEYSVPGVSVSIIDFEGTELLNTAKVDSSGLPTQRVYKILVSGQTDLKWMSWTEQVPLQQNSQHRTDTPIVSVNGPLEQIRLSNESSEYMYYSTIVSVSGNDEDDEDDEDDNTFELQFAGRMANAYMVYVDDHYVNETFNYDHDAGTVAMNVRISDTSQWLSNGTHTITILSSSQGIHNLLANQQGPDAQDKKGLVGAVVLVQSSTNQNGQNVMKQYNLTKHTWNQWIGLTGENLKVATEGGMNSVEWTTPAVTSNAMTWYMTTFSIPENVKSEGVLLIDIGSQTNQGMRRGHFWLNGQDMGHYNNVVMGGLLVQQYYFVAYDDVNIGTDTFNTLIFAEELPNVVLSNVNIVVSNVVIP